MQDRFAAPVASVVRGCIVGTAFGDAWGIPNENKTFEELSLVRSCWINQVVRGSSTSTRPGAAASLGGCDSRSSIPAVEDADGARAAVVGANSKILSSMGSTTGSNSLLPSQNGGAGGFSSTSGRAKTDDDGSQTPKNQQVHFVPPREVPPLAWVPVPAEHPFIPPGFELGAYTDDTQLTCAMARALFSTLGDEGAINKQGSSSPSSLSLSTMMSATGKSVAAGGGGSGAMRRGRRDEGFCADVDPQSGAVVNRRTKSSGAGADLVADAAENRSDQHEQQQDNSDEETEHQNQHQHQQQEENSSSIIVKAINQKGWFHIAREHVREVQRTTAGWGGTAVACQRLVQPVEETREALDRAKTRDEYNAILASFQAHRHSGNAQAIGNGVLMKLTPLALLFGVEQALNRRLTSTAGSSEAGTAHATKQQKIGRVRSRELLIVELARLTHGSSDAIVTALVHTEMLCCVFAGWFETCCMSPLYHRAGGLLGTQAAVERAMENSSGVKLSSSASKSSSGTDKKKNASLLSAAVAAAGADAAAAASSSSSSSSFMPNNKKKNDHGGGGSPTSNSNLPRSPLFQTMPDARRRASFVASLFRAALDHGVSFCEELEANTSFLPPDTSDLVAPPAPISSAGSAGATANSAGGGASTSSSSSSSSSTSAATAALFLPPLFPPSTTTAAQLDYAGSFRKVASALKQVRVLADSINSRHIDLDVESFETTDLFPFIPAREREQMEERITQVSMGGTFHCVHSSIFVWCYLACFAGPIAFAGTPHCRPDIVALAIAHAALIGGDTDSNAAIIGGVIAAIMGSESVEPFVPQHPHTEVMEEAIDNLSSSVMKLLCGGIFER